MLMSVARFFISSVALATRQSELMLRMYFCFSFPGCGPARLVVKTCGRKHIRYRIHPDCDTSAVLSSVHKSRSVVERCFVVRPFASHSGKVLRWSHQFIVILWCCVPDPWSSHRSRLVISVENKVVSAHSEQCESVSLVHFEECKSFVWHSVRCDYCLIRVLCVQHIW